MDALGFGFRFFSSSFSRVNVLCIPVGEGLILLYDFDWGFRAVRVLRKLGSL